MTNKLGRREYILVSFNFKFRNCVYCSPWFSLCILLFLTCSTDGNKAYPSPSLSPSLPLCSSLMFDFLHLFFQLIFFFAEYVGLSCSTSASPVVCHSLLPHPQSATPQRVASSVVSERYISVFFFGLIPECTIVAPFFRMIFLCNRVWCNAIKTCMLKYNIQYHQ